jgi:hypothetical protein
MLDEETDVNGEIPVFLGAALVDEEEVAADSGEV